MMTDPADKPIRYNVSEWIEENKQFFVPPVCNKIMHGSGQMKMFFVGGPNQRKDYHIDCGEELFYQVRGDMTLKVIIKGQHRDIHIREGEMFLLPGRIQHSPQRFENTIGVVLERDRHPDTEKDGLRYFIERDGEVTTETLYEKWFYCSDLGSQLAPIIKAFFASEPYRTGVPIPGSITDNPPVTLDTDRDVESPFSFSQWLQEHSDQIDNNGKVQVFDVTKYQFQVYVYGRGTNGDHTDVADTWLWQVEGKSILDVDGETMALCQDDSVLVQLGKRFSLSQDDGCRTLVCYQDPTKATTWPRDG